VVTGTVGGAGDGADRDGDRDRDGVGSEANIKHVLQCRRERSGRNGAIPTIIEVIACPCTLSFYAFTLELDDLPGKLTGREQSDYFGQGFALLE